MDLNGGGETERRKRLSDVYQAAFYSLYHSSDLCRGMFVLIVCGGRGSGDGYDGQGRQLQEQVVIVCLIVREGLRLYVVGMNEGVVCLWMCSVQDFCVDYLRCVPAKIEAQGVCVVQIGVGDTYYDVAVVLQRCSGVDGGYFGQDTIGSSEDRVVFGDDRDVERLLVGLVHTEDMVGGCEQHTVFVRHYHCLQDIDHLCDIGHADTVGVVMENVEGKCSDHRIAHGVLLVEVSVDGVGFLRPPSTPFVDKQADTAFRVVLIHDVAMAFDDGFDATALAERPVVVVVGELCGGAFVAVPSFDGVVVERDGIHSLADPLHECFCPVVVVVGCATCNFVESVVAIISCELGISPIEVAIVFGCHLSATSPTLVSYADVFDFPCFVTAVLLAQFGERGLCIGCHVLDPIRHFLDTATSNIGTDIGFASQQFAEVEEFVGAKGVVFGCTAPVSIDYLGSHGRVAYSVSPVIGVGKASTGPPHDGDMQVFERMEDIVAIAVGVGNG